MVQSVLFENLPYTSKKHTFRNREEVVNSNVLVFKNSRIGIGTQEPEENYRVTISGNTVIRGTLTAEILSFTASNLNHLTIDNLGTQEGINLIQRGYDPYIVFRSNETSIVNIIDGNGNVGIGEAAPLEKLVVRGKIIAEDLLLTSESIYQKPLQVPPIHQTFIVKDRADVEFMVETTGLYAASNDNVEVYLNGYKLAYFSSNLKDYVVSYSNQYEPPKTFFNITLTSVAKANDVIDVTFWPTTLEQVEGTLGGYSTQSIYSYWDRGLDKSVYYNAGNIGIGTYQPRYALDVVGKIKAIDFEGNGARLSNISGTFEEINSKDMVYLIGNIGIGTTFTRGKLDVRGTIYCSNIITVNDDLINFNYITSNVISFYNYDVNSKISLDNYNPGPTIQIRQHGSNNIMEIYQDNNIFLCVGSNGNIGVGHSNISLGKLAVKGDIVPETTLIYDLGTSNLRWRDIYLSGNTIDLNGALIQKDASTGGIKLSTVLGEASDFVSKNIYGERLGIGTNITRNIVDINGSMIVSSNIGIGTTNPIVSLEVWSSNAILLPKGSNLSRPEGVTGYIRYNTETQTFEGFGAGEQWGSLGGVKNVVGDTFITAEYTPGNNDRSLHFYTCNLERLIVNANGNVGIGTTQPLNKLEIVGKAIITDKLGIGTYLPNYSVDISGDINLSGDIRKNGTILGLSGDSLWTSNIDGGIYYTEGNLGIGTHIPMNALDVYGDIYTTGTLTCANLSVIGDFVTMNTVTSNTEQMVITNDGTGPALKVIQSGNNSVAEFYDNESGVVMYIGNLGNVGLGTNTPTQKLDVRGNIYSSDSLSCSNVFADGLIGIGTNTPTQRLDVRGNIYSSGNITCSNVFVDGLMGLGTINPTQKLDVRGNIYSSGTITCSNISIIGDFVTMNTVTSNTEQIVITNDGTGPALKVIQSGNNSVAEFYDSESGIAMYIGNLGNVGIGTTNMTAGKLVVYGGDIYCQEDIVGGSDIRYKTNIRTIENSIEIINSLRGVRYDRVSNNKASFGVIAQEVEKIIPEVIRTDIGDYKGVVYTQIIPILIEAIKKLEERICVLEGDKLSQ